MKESIYNLRKQIKKFYKQYFTVYGDYTSLLPDKIYLKKRYKLKMGKKLNLKNPQTFNEKLQWLKLYNRNPKYTLLVDKYAVRDYIAKTIGEEYLIPLLGAWNSVDDIDFEKLPNQFVLKTNHDNGVVVCTDKNNFNIDEAKRQLNIKMSRNFYKKGREWPYKNIPRKIIAEQYMIDESGYELRDYKIFCFDSVPKMLFVVKNRSNKDIETTFDFYDENFVHMPLKNEYNFSDTPMEKPKSFEKMKKLAQELSADIPFSRIDFYDVNGKIYFGEITLFHNNGMVPFEPEEWDYKIGSWLKLPSKKHRRIF